MSPLTSRVLVVEDNEFTRATLCGALRGAGVNVVGDTGAASDAITLAGDLRPDVALLDLDLGRGPSGIDLAVALRRDIPAIGIVILTSYEDPRLTGRNVDHLPPASQYLVKADLRDTDVLVLAIERALTLARHPQRETMPGLPPARGDLARLTDAQVDVMRLLAEGRTNADIARQRGISAASVERTVLAIARELGIDAGEGTNRRVLIARAYLRMSGAEHADDGI